MTWGVKENVLERYAAAGISQEQISFSRETYRSSTRHAGRAVGGFRNYYGPTMNAFDAAEAAGQADYCRTSSRRCSAARTPPNGTTSIPATYLRVEVHV